MTPSARRLRWAAWAAWTISVSSYLASVLLMILNAEGDDATLEVAALAIEKLAFVGIATLSLLILRAQPHNLVGWGIMCAGVGFPLEEFFSQFTDYAVANWGEIGLTLAAGWVSRWIWLLGILAVPIILLYYPNGKLVSPRWRFAPYTMWSLGFLAFVLTAFDSTPMEEFSDLPNPLGVEAVTDIPDPFYIVVFWGYFILPILFGAASVIPRFIRSEGVERKQMKIMAWVGAVAVLYFFVFESVLTLGPIADPVLSTLFTVFIGGAITAGIVRYRVFEIDRIISRTVSYTVLVALLGVLFAAGVVWLPTALGLSDSPLLVAATTLLVAALFNPLRKRIQELVDRRFNRSRYEAQLVEERFTVALQEAHSADELVEVWLQTVDDSLGPQTSGVWINAD